MAWGCKPENKPDGCGWASWQDYPTLDLREWWCDTCERSGHTTPIPPKEDKDCSDG